MKDEVKTKKPQFATGMNGDEDLGEDITMKGDKFKARRASREIQLGH